MKKILFALLLSVSISHYFEPKPTQAMTIERLRLLVYGHPVYRT